MNAFEALSDGSLVLDVGEFCIQTAARRAHGELARALLDGDPGGPAIEAVVDMLARFLGATDFAALRASQPELAGGQRCRVRLYRDAAGAVRWQVVEGR